jgi:hypothetical protein
MRARCLSIWIALGAALPARPAGAEEPFAGCKVNAPTPEGWKVLCRTGWLLSISDGAPGFRLPEYLDATATGLQAATRGQVHRQPVPLRLSPGQWIVDGLRVTEAQEPGPSFTLVAHTQRAEGLRVVTCTGLAANEARCKRAIQSVAANPWRAGPPASVPRNLPAAKIAGREYQAPRGCQVTTQPNLTFVGCNGEPVLLWAQPPNDLGAIEGLVTAQMNQSGMQERTRIPCWVEGIKTDCRVFRSGQPSDRRAGYFARATVRTQPIAVVCLSSDGALPPACSSVMSLPRPRP